MGYASYSEDIIRRLEEGLADVRERRFLQVVTATDTKLSRDLELLIGVATREIGRLRNLAEVATDDQLDHAQRIIHLQVENDHLRRAIENSSDANLAEKYYHLETERRRLQSLLDKDLVEEFCELDDKYVQLRERERKLLEQEARLLEKLKVAKQNHLDCVETQHTVVKKLEDKVKELENLLEIHRAEDRNKLRRIESIDSVIAKKDDEIVDLTQQNAALQKKLKDVMDELEFVMNASNAYKRYADPS